MKKQTIIIMLGLILTIGTVVAITVGQILTQQQIDNADIRIMNLNPSFETKANGNLRIGNCRTDVDVCTAYVTVGTTVKKVQDYDNETFEPIGEVYYEVVTKTIPILFRTTRYYNIAHNSSRQEAFDTLMIELRPKAIRKLKEEVQRINSFKTADILDKQNELLSIVDGQNVTNIEEE